VRSHRPPRSEWRGDIRSPGCAGIRSASNVGAAGMALFRAAHLISGAGCYAASIARPHANWRRGAPGGGGRGKGKAPGQACGALPSCCSCSSGPPSTGAPSRWEQGRLGSPNAGAVVLGSLAGRRRTRERALSAGSLGRMQAQAAGKGREGGGGPRRQRWTGAAETLIIPPAALFWVSLVFALRCSTAAVAPRPTGNRSATLPPPSAPSATRRVASRAANAR
jgi:hypothetical protein